MLGNDYPNIPDDILHDAVRKTLSEYKLTGGSNNNPYNFRCPICGDSKKHPHKKRGYVLYKNSQWVYMCHNECGSMSFLNFLKQYHNDVYKNVVFDGITTKKTFKKFENNVKKVINNNSNYVFKEGELLSLSSNHSLAKYALDYCVSRKIPYNVYSKWFVCIKDSKFHELDENGNVILNDKGYPKGNEYGNRLIIPYYRLGGKWIQFDARSLDSKQILRYKNLAGVDRELYKIDWLDVNKPFFLLEGSINASFIKNSVAFGGTKHLTKFFDQYPALLHNSHNGIIIMDNDDAGINELNKVIKLGFNWFNWSDIEPVQMTDGNIRNINDINDLVLYTNLVKFDKDGFIEYDSLSKFIKKSDGGILSTMLYGNRDKIKLAKYYEQKNNKNIQQDINSWLLK